MNKQLPDLEFDDDLPELDFDNSPEELDFNEEHQITEVAKKVGLDPQKAIEINKDSALYKIGKSQIVDPALKTVSGFSEGVSSFYKTLDSASKLTEHLTGGATESVTKPLSSLFSTWSEKTKKNADYLLSLTESQKPDFVLNMLGGAVPLATEFAVMPGGFVSKMAFNSALKEYDESGELKNIPESALKGASSAMLLQSAPKLISTATDLIRKTSKPVARAWVKLVTNSESLADDFIKNIDKYNLKTITRQKFPDMNVVKETNRLKLQAENNKLNDLTKELNIEKQNKLSQIKEAKNSALKELKDAQTQIKFDFAEARKDNIGEAVVKTHEAQKKIRASLNDNATVIFDNALVKNTAIRDSYGKAVREAENSIIARNPDLGINSNILKERVLRVQKEVSPFPVYKMDAKSNILDSAGKPLNVVEQRVPRTGVRPDPQDYEVFKKVVEDVDVYTTNENIPIKYLQDLKKRIFSLQEHYFGKGDYELGKTYKALYGAVNPANIVTDNPSLNEKLGELAQANKAYTPVVKAYDKALSMYYRKDNQGTLVPDITKLINAIKTNNTPILREYAKADMNLPINERILPQVKNIISETERAIEREAASVKLLRKQFSNRNYLLNKKLKDDYSKKNLEETRLLKSASIKAKETDNARSSAYRDYYQAMETKLRDDEMKYGYLLGMRAMRPQEGTWARLVQNYLGLGAVITPGGFKAIPLAGILATTPRVAGKTIQRGYSFIKEIDSIGSLAETTMKNKFINQAFKINP